MKKVLFLNQPKLSGNEHNKDQDERRLYLIKEIEKLLVNKSIFDGDILKVSFFQEGVSSLVCKIQAETQAFVLKIQIRPTGPKGEGLFLKSWNNAGITVPIVFDEGYLGEHYYIVMNFIDAPFGNSENVNENFFWEMGKTLRKMHEVPANGFGRLDNNNLAEFSSFKSWVNEDKQITNQINYIKSNNILPESEFGSIEKEIDNLINKINNNSSVFCHGDFSPNNIFVTNPITIFDPVPSFNNPYIDIGRSIIKIWCKDFENEIFIKKFLLGYFDGENYDIDLLKSSLLFNAYTIIPALSKTNQNLKINAIKKHLKSLMYNNSNVF